MKWNLLRWLILALFPLLPLADVDGAPSKAAQLNSPAVLLEKGRAVRLIEDPNLWYDIRDLEIEGKGWQDTEEFYDRLPLRAKAMVRKEVWELGQRSAGLCSRFVTDATSIQVRWDLRFDRLGMEHMPATGVSGLDLYIRDANGGWGWVAQGRPSKFPVNQVGLVKNLEPGWHEFLLYLPLYNGLNFVQIGIAPDNSISKPLPRPPDRSRPICFYGTSIVQGGCASRPGMVHTAILGRRLDYPVINLGFSGNGPMELELAKFMAELDPAVLVVDCLPNMEPPQVVERAVPFVKILRQSRPETPIVLVENIAYQGSPYLLERLKGYKTKNAALRQAYQQMISEGIKKVFYLPCDELLGHDEEATVDGTHPNDLGFMRMADAMEPILRKALESRTP